MSIRGQESRQPSNLRYRILPRGNMTNQWKSRPYVLTSSIGTEHNKSGLAWTPVDAIKANTSGARRRKLSVLILVHVAVCTRSASWVAIRWVSRWVMLTNSRFSKLRAPFRMRLPFFIFYFQEMYILRSTYFSFCCITYTKCRGPYLRETLVFPCLCCELLYWRNRDTNSLALSIQRYPEQNWRFAFPTTR